MSSWAEARRILCVRLDGIGDVLMTSPAIRALKYGAPGRTVTLLTSRAGALAGDLIPEVDDVIVYDAPWMKASEPQPNAEVDRLLVEPLRARGFDAVAIFNVYDQNPLAAVFLAYLADIPLRLAHLREKPYHLLTNWVRDEDAGALVRHEVRRQLDLVATVGCRVVPETLSASIPERSRRAAARGLAGAGLDTRRWVLIHPGASAPSRHYSAWSYAAAADILAARGVSVVFSGDSSEVALVSAIRRLMRAPSYSVAGRLSFAELAGLIELAPCLCTNNTGPAHVAAAVRTPTVVAYALTNPQHTPWMVPSRVLFHDVPCKFCHSSICPEGHHRCLSLVDPGDVARAVIELAEETGVWSPDRTGNRAGVGGSFAELPTRGKRGIHAGSKQQEGAETRRRDEA